MKPRLWIFLLAVTMIALAITSTVTVSTAAAADVSLKAPFASGITVKVVTGYNNPIPGERCVIGASPDHCGNQKYGLDLAPQNTSDTRILAPLPGKIAWVSGDCLGIRTEDNLNLNVCHFSRFNVSAGATISRGQVIGWRSSGWIHISLDDRYHNSAKPPVAFNGARTLEGRAFDPLADSVRNQHNGTTFTSTNGSSSSSGSPRFCEHNQTGGYGRCLDLGVGTWDLTEFNFNDVLTTIIVPAGSTWRVTVYEHVSPATNYCYGAGWIFTSNGGRWEINLYSGNLNFNDRASCVVVQRL